jgi:hypothetical protein
MKQHCDFQKGQVHFENHLKQNKEYLGLIKVKE